MSTTDAQLPVVPSIMDVPAKIRQEHLKPVSSIFVYQPSSTQFHPNGLYSEEIFGQVGSPERLVTKGYINLNTRIILPQVYNAVIRLRSWYEEILSGSRMVKFNSEKGDFEESEDDDAKTGYAYFLKHFPKLTFERNKSLTHNDKIDLIEMFKNEEIITQYLVAPAGMRDFDPSTNTSASKELNSMYITLINYSMGIPQGSDENPLYDNFRFAIQKKANEVYDYWFNFLSGKNGWIARKYTSRGLTWGTRNVISSTSTIAKSRRDPQFIKSNETKLPLFQAIKAYQPAVVFQLKSLYLSQIFDQSSDQVALIDPKTYALEYFKITDKEKDRFITPEGIQVLISRFWQTTFRDRPASVLDASGKPRYMFMVYDTGESIYTVRNIKELEQTFGASFDPAKLRPMTWVEIFYISTWMATRSRHMTNTRYPVVCRGGVIPAKVHLTSTDPSRIVQYRYIYNTDIDVMLPEYPILGEGYIDSTQLHPSKLADADADFDGDQMNTNGILTDEANAETGAYLDGLGSIINPEGKLDMGVTALSKLIFYNLTYDEALKNLNAPQDKK